MESLLFVPMEERPGQCLLALDLRFGTWQARSGSECNWCKRRPRAGGEMHRSDNRRAAGAESLDQTQPPSFSAASIQPALWIGKELSRQPEGAHLVVIYRSRRKIGQRNMNMHGILEHDVSGIGIQHFNGVSGETRQGGVEFPGKYELRAVIIKHGLSGSGWLARKATKRKH